MSWFEKLFGFDESVHSVYENIVIEYDIHPKMRSLVNGRCFNLGNFTKASLRDFDGLHFKTTDLGIRVTNISADITDVHVDRINDGATIQVASQFNSLEMTHELITPSMGVSRYADDYTQGPACAISCGADTVFRNYFVKHGNGNVGQLKYQMSTLDYFLDSIGANSREFFMNGYYLPDSDQLEFINDAIKKDRERLKSLLECAIGVRSQVTIGSDNVVNQVFCSALPVSYNQKCSIDLQEPLGRLILESAYEITLKFAAIYAKYGGSNKVYLTKLGGGAFGNPSNWTIDAIKKAIEACASYDLDVKIVHFGQVDLAYESLST